MANPASGADKASFDVCGIGMAIVDIISESSEAFLKTHRVKKGVMTLVDEARADFLYSRIGPAVEMSGGSVANTVAGIAALGGRPAFIGKIRNDQLGAIFRHDLRTLGVHFSTPPAIEGPATARCLILVTPDAQRSMNTFLGAAGGLISADIDPDIVGNSKILFLEGYLFDKPEAQATLMLAARIAHEAGRLVAVSLSDPLCVDRHREAFRELVKRQTDILVANEHELMSLYQTESLEEALKTAEEECFLAVCTRSEKGAVISSGGRRIKIDAEPVPQVVDTTGAGDLFAAGFLYGLTRDMDLAICGKLGALAASEVISHYGPRPQHSLKDYIQKRIGKI